MQECSSVICGLVLVITVANKDAFPCCSCVSNVYEVLGYGRHKMDFHISPLLLVFLDSMIVSLHYTCLQKHCLLPNLWNKGTAKSYSKMLMLVVVQTVFHMCHFD